jgi:hypothetical protein
MIKFFRHIRQRMIKESKVSKYLLYAIGEIVLVVIGILIALQINNWNEQRKNSHAEAEYYCGLLEDVQQDSVQTEGLIQEVEARLKASNQALRLLQQERTKSIEIGEQLGLAITAIFVDFKPNNSTFEDLKSSNLSLIKDKEIIGALNDYYNTIESLKSIIMLNGKNAVDVAFAHDDRFASGETQASMRYGRLKTAMEPDVYKAIPIDTAEVVSNEMQQRLFNETLVYLSSNARQLELYTKIKDHSARVASLLQNKCRNIE